MGSGFIAALLVMALITAFIFVLLRMLAANTGDRIRDKIIVQIQAYDVLLQRKEAELTALRREIEIENKKRNTKLESNQHKEVVPYGVFVLPETVYCREDFYDDYTRMREKFQFNHQDEILQIYQEHEQMQDMERIALLDGLADKLTLDNVYKISLFHSEEQIELLKEILNQEEQAVMEDYIRAHKNFQCIEFHQWLSMQRLLLDKQCIVKTAHKEENYNGIGKWITTIYDENLCEGFQIQSGNRLYDYGVRRSELV